MIIGITGTLGAGKDTAAAYLQSLGFAHHSLSDVIREVLRERGDELSLDNLIRVGNELRVTEGPAYLADVILKRIQRLAVVSSIRHPAELAAFKATGRFFLCAIDAPIDVRFARIQARVRPGEEQSFEEFKAIEQRQIHGVGPNQRLQEIIAAADYQITNDKDLADLHTQIDAMLADMRGRLSRRKKTSQDQLTLL